MRTERHPQTIDSAGRAFETGKSTFKA